MSWIALLAASLLAASHVHEHDTFKFPAELQLLVPPPLEGRPPPGDASPLQALVDAAAPGATLEVAPGEYRGDLHLVRPIRLVGRGRPRLVGSGRGSVIRVRAADVTIQGLDIDGAGGGEGPITASGIHVAGERVVVRDCRLVSVRTGIFLQEADGAVVEANVIRGLPTRSAGEKGPGIHLWRGRGFVVDGNDVAGTRDGIYVQDSTRPGAEGSTWRPELASPAELVTVSLRDRRTLGTISRNTVRETRYGLHVMASEFETLEDNLVERSEAGAVLMYSRRITLRRNTFQHNRDVDGVGLLLKEVADAVVQGNLLLDDTHGIDLEGTSGGYFVRNVVAVSDVGVVLGPGCRSDAFATNAFVGNLTQVSALGPVWTDFNWNYWSSNDEPDLDGCGRSDRPLPLSSAFDLFRGRVSATDLLAHSPADLALAAAERAFPVLERVRVAVDRAPRIRPPELPEVPMPPPRDEVDLPGLGLSAALIVAGLVSLSAGSRPRRSRT